MYYSGPKIVLWCIFQSSTWTYYQFTRYIIETVNGPALCSSYNHCLTTVASNQDEYQHFPWRSLKLKTEGCQLWICLCGKSYTSVSAKHRHITKVMWAICSNMYFQTSCIYSVMVLDAYLGLWARFLTLGASWNPVQVNPYLYLCMCVSPLRCLCMCVGPFSSPLVSAASAWLLLAASLL